MKALITGVTGQDGYYLSKYLIDKGYEVHGLIRRSSTFNTDRIDGLISDNSSQTIFNYYSDLLDSSSLNNLIASISPDEIYNLLLNLMLQYLLITHSTQHKLVLLAL